MEATEVSEFTEAHESRLVFSVDSENSVAKPCFKLDLSAGHQ